MESRSSEELNPILMVSHHAARGAIEENSFGELNSTHEQLPQEKLLQHEYKCLKSPSQSARIFHILDYIRRPEAVRAKISQKIFPTGQDSTVESELK